ncbi:hypothetical protein [Streptomyces sp. NPDC046371]|uniref:hypothetical protein n=1 Tax=Streptomyces sp. NPDC046371 TaxID=3154916 RepID=UPI0033D61ED6
MRRDIGWGAHADTGWGIASSGWDLHDTTWSHPPHHRDPGKGLAGRDTGWV